MRIFATIAQAKPDFIRLLDAGIAVGVVFNHIDWSNEQLVTVLALSEAAFQVLTRLTHKRDIESLNAMVNGSAHTE